MGNKATCPGCNSHTSAVWAADGDDAPCPHCGLSAASRFEIQAVRARQADEQLKAQLEDALLRAGRAEAEVEALRLTMQRVRWALEGTDQE